MSERARRAWYPLAEVLAHLEQACADARATSLRAREVEAELAKASVPGELPEPRPEAIPEVDVPALRADLRGRLGWLKARLGEVLTERETYYALFPVVLYADELVLAAVGPRGAAWPPLQRELYEVDNGGELFFQTLDTLLRREETAPEVLEVFLYCLNAGFSGQYLNDPAKREEYRSRLVEKIPVDRPVSASAADDGLAPVELVEFPWRYYALMALGIAGCAGVLQLLGYFEGTG
jgi:type IV/VI secretion system ImpK/VasF family protein